MGGNREAALPVLGTYRYAIQQYSKGGFREAALVAAQGGC